DFRQSFRLQDQARGDQFTQGRTHEVLLPHDPVVVRAGLAHHLAGTREIQGRLAVKTPGAGPVDQQTQFTVIDRLTHADLDTTQFIYHRDEPGEVHGQEPRDGEAVRVTRGDLRDHLRQAPGAADRIRGVQFHRVLSADRL